MRLHLLSGGAAQGLVQALAPQFKAQSGCDIESTFGAVGAMRDKLIAGAPADVVILTRALIDALTASGHVRPGSAVDIGLVYTGLAVRAGDPAPTVSEADGLRAALSAAQGIYFPDPQLATAGIHFAKVIDALGLREALAARLHTFPNGAAAMRALAGTQGGSIGCTQVTEILNTPGVTLAGLLPKAFELATVYTAGICSAAERPEQAQALTMLLTSEAARPARTQAGFTG